MIRRKYNSIIIPNLLPYLHNKQGKHYTAKNLLKRFCGTGGAFLLFKCVIISLYLGVQCRTHDILELHQTKSIIVIISTLIFPLFFNNAIVRK